MGLSYSFAQFFNDGMTKDILDSYRANFIPSDFIEEPEISVSYLVTTAEADEEAKFEAWPQDISRLMLMKGRIVPLMTPEEVQNSTLTEVDCMQIQASRNVHLVGSAKNVADQLQQEQTEYGFEEAMICSIPHSQEKRLDVYRLLA